MSSLRAQGATEYLVLLAVVLIVALVSVALLGFFPGMASDAKLTQSKTYWSSASPVAILEAGARFVYDSGSGNYTFTYFRIRNNGNYPITITKILAGNTSITYMWTGGWYPEAHLSSRVRMAPGEEFMFGNINFQGVPDLGSGNRSFFTFSGSDATSYNANFMNAATSLCSRSAPYGYLTVNNFGFEYTETIEGQMITKRQVGTAPLIVQCMNNYN